MLRHTLAATLLLTSPVLAAADEPTMPVSEAQRGSFVTVAGSVTRIMDEDTFRLADASGDIRIYIGPNRMPVRAGDAVTVSGFVDDGFGPREIYADTVTLPDGSMVTFERRYD